MIAASSSYRPYIVETINLDCRVAHLDYNGGKLRELKKKYGPEVRIDTPSHLGSVLIASESESVSAADMVAEFEIELLDDYFGRALAHRHAPGNMEA